MSGTSHRWSKFWWSDWQGDKSLRVVSLTARGLWMEMLCIAHDAEPYGHVLINGRQPTLKQLSAIIGCATERVIRACLVELEEAGIYSRTEDGTIYCRRMVRDKAAAEYGRECGLQGGNPALKRKECPPAKPNGGIKGGLTPPHNQTLKLEAEADSEAEEREELPAESQNINRGVSAGRSPAPPARTYAHARERPPPLRHSELRSDALSASRRTLWRHGPQVIRCLTGMPERNARAFLGRLLSHARDDCAGLLVALNDAERDPPIDPVAWLTRAARARASPAYRNGFLQIIEDEGMPSCEAPELDNPVTTFLARYADAS